jgi:site-specific recombinase XerD
VGTFGAVQGQEPGNKGRKFPPETLTPDEVNEVIGECSTRSRTGIRNRALLTLLYRSGLRISEALALKESDVRFKTHTITVLHGKGDRASARGLHPDAEDTVRRRLDIRERLKLRRGAPLFCTLDGAPLSDRYVRNLLHRLADRAGIEKRVTPHGLRHTYADELRASGMDLVKISKLLGHSSVAITHRYLDHLSNEQAIAALAATELPKLTA